MKLDEVRDAVISGIKENFSRHAEYYDAPFGLAELADCIIMELIKHAYDTSAEHYALRSRLPKVGDALYDSRRGELSRRLKYANYYKTKQHERMLETFGKEQPELIALDMTTIESRLAGYQLTEMQLDELEAMNQIRLLQNVINKRICSTKKISNQEFMEMFAQYDRWIEELKAGAIDNHSIVVNTFKLYTVEWVYSLELLFRCACMGEQNPDVNAFDAITLLEQLDDIYVFCMGKESGDDTIKAGKHLITNKRFVLHRLALIESALDSTKQRWVSNKMQLYIYSRYLISELSFGNLTINEYIEKHTCEDDWAEFIKSHYRLLWEPRKHEWTNKRIRIFRELVNCLYMDIEPPKL